MDRTAACLAEVSCTVLHSVVINKTTIFKIVAFHCFSNLFIRFLPFADGAQREEPLGKPTSQNAGKSQNALLGSKVIIT